MTGDNVAPAGIARDCYLRRQDQDDTAAPPAGYDAPDTAVPVAVELAPGSAVSVPAAEAPAAREL